VETGAVTVMAPRLNDMRVDAAGFHKQANYNAEDIDKAQAAIKAVEIHYGAKHPKAVAKIADGPWAPVRCFTKARCSNVPSTSAQIPGAQRKRQTGDRRGMNGLAGKQVSGLIAVSRIAQTTLRSIRV
jgi:hypothetical protein